MAERLKLTDLMPADFLGDGSQMAKDWIVTFRRYEQVHALTDAETLDRISMFLNGIALSWFKNKQFVTVEAFIKAFLIQFGEFKSRQAMIEALTNKRLLQGQSVIN